MWRGLGRAIRALLLAMGLTAAPAFAESSATAVKSAFIYNFAKFVEWPATAFPADDAPLQLCTWGEVLDGRLRQLEGREAQGHVIAVRNIASPAEIATCHILVLGEMDDGQRRRLLQSTQQASVLTISDAPAANGDGSMITLFVQSNRVQFSVNLAAAQSAGLKMSARMLQLANSVRGGRP